MLKVVGAIMCIGAAYMIAVVCEPVHAQSRDVSAGRASITGRITVGGSGEPVAGALVTVTNENTRSQSSAVADSQGAFVVEKLAAGTYAVSATKDGFVRTAYGEIGSTGVPRRLSIDATARTTGIDIGLKRGGVITGMLTDSNGVPASGAVVSAMRYDAALGQHRLVPTGQSVLTDDRGEYRLFALPPATYYVLAKGRGNRNTAVTGGSSVEGMAPTYYPGTMTLGGAQSVRIRGEDSAIASFTLASARLFTVSGTLPQPGKGPATIAVRSLDEETSLSNRQVSTRVDGSFVIPGVTPGHYTLQTMVTDYAQAVGDTRILFAAVTVDGDDVSNVALLPVSRVKVSGRVTADGLSAADAAPTKVRVGVIKVSLGGVFGPQREGQVNSDLTFALETWPGLGFFRVSGDPSWYLSAIRVNGADVTDSGVEFRQGSDITGVELEVTRHPALVAGIVVAEPGVSTDELSVVLFSTDEEKWARPSGRFATLARLDQNGRFAHSLPPGEYYAAVISRSIQGDWSDPQSLRAFRAEATTFSVTSGKSTGITLSASRGVQR
jgi:hypothetical protein